MSTPKAKDLLTNNFLKKYLELTPTEKAKVIKELEAKFDEKGEQPRTADEPILEGGADAFE